MSTKPTLLIIVNKLWEAQPVVACIRNSDLRPRSFPPELAPRTISVPRRDGSSLEEPSLARFETTTCFVELWCIQNVMDLKTSSSSSTEEKARVLPFLFARVDVTGVIAVGTAAWPHADENRNGSVALGTGVYVHNSYAEHPNSNSNWTHPRCGIEIASAPRLFDLVDATVRSEVEVRLLPPPLACWSGARGILGAPDSIAVGNVNITDYAQYPHRDPQAIQAATDAGLKSRLTSLETTHGLIRLQSESPFLFVSGIVNTVGCFAEMRKFDKAQNFVSAHNAGLLVAWLLSRLA